MPSPDVDPLRLLFVEDNADIRESFGMYFELVGLKVHEAGDGATALRLAGEYPIDVVVMDITLPDIQGDELARSLSEHPSMANVPLIALSGRPVPAKELFFATLVKPVDPARVVEVVHAATTKRRSSA